MLEKILIRLKKNWFFVLFFLSFYSWVEYSHFSTVEEIKEHLRAKDELTQLKIEKLIGDIKQNQSLLQEGITDIKQNQISHEVKKKSKRK